MLFENIIKNNETDYKTIDKHIKLNPNSAINLNAVQIAFKLQTDGVKAAEELTQRIYQFNDIVIKEALQYSAEDLQNKEQLLQFQDALLSQINAYMQNGKVTKVFITSKIIQ